MDTFVTVEVVEPSSTPGCIEGVERAFGWFHEIERLCSRFDLSSEVMQLSTQIASPTVVSRLLFEAVRFAIAVARLSGGAFDPTIGTLLEARGYNRNYRTGES